jgi:hypothetical protein
MCQINDLLYIYKLHNFLIKNTQTQSHINKNKHSHKQKQILRLKHIHIHTHTNFILKLFHMDHTTKYL